MRARLLQTALLLAGVVQPVVAQVGTTPDQSPFRDLEKRQDITLLAGPSFGGRDKVGAAPRGGVAVGLRYDIRLGNSPLAFTSMFVRQAATRDVLQPGQPLTNRNGGSVSRALNFFDAAFTLLLTGSKSWHSIVPSVTIGAGLVSGGGITDSSNFNFSNKFAPNVGFGVKYARDRSRWTLRADVTNRIYNVKYPDRFRDTTPGVPRIVAPGTNGGWTRNTMVTLGLVREIGRR